jgi:hypothetical protein
MNYEERMLKVAREEEQYLIKLRDRLEMQRIIASTDRSHGHQVSKMQGIITMLDAAGIDRTEFNWINGI